MLNRWCFFLSIWIMGFVLLPLLLIMMFCWYLLSLWIVLDILCFICNMFSVMVVIVVLFLSTGNIHIHKVSTFCIWEDSSAFRVKFHRFSWFSIHQYREWVLLNVMWYLFYSNSNIMAIECYFLMRWYLFCTRPTHWVVCTFVYVYIYC
jgi:hypothetical protein